MEKIPKQLLKEISDDRLKKLPKSLLTEITDLLENAEEISSREILGRHPRRISYGTLTMIPVEVLDELLVEMFL